MAVSHDFSRCQARAPPQSPPNSHALLRDAPFLLSPSLTSPPSRTLTAAPLPFYLFPLPLFGATSSRSSTWICSSCGGRFQGGQRWFCAVCQDAYCFKCKACACLMWLGERGLGEKERGKVQETIAITTSAWGGRESAKARAVSFCTPFTSLHGHTRHARFSFSFSLAHSLVSSPPPSPFPSSGTSLNSAGRRCFHSTRHQAASHGRTARWR